jgi:Domain of unknown function (DUF1707)
MDETNDTRGIVDSHTPRDQMRAADTDRQRVAEELRAAHDEGRLDLTEYDERVQQAWAARTYGELETLTADLPQARPLIAPQARPEVRQPRRQHGHRRGGRAAAAAWAGVSLLNLMIWALVCLSTMSWIYPWWIWVAGPWGAMLLAGWLGERTRGPGPPR